MAAMIAAPAASKHQTRRDVELFVEWVLNKPAELALAPGKCAPLLAVILGHDVEVDALLELIVATGVRNQYRGTTAEIDAQQKRVDTAIDHVLDVTECVTCEQVIPEQTTYIVCDNGDTFCEWQCHQARHGQGCHAAVYRP